MPWTLSHPAAVLPLRRLSPRPLNFAALVVGSMTPDIGFYIDRFDLSDFAHTFPGSFIACVPTGVIMLFVFYLFARPVCYALPAPHRQSLLPLCPDFPTSPTSWAIILISLLLGAWTHNFWDAFTHEHGWFVERISWLQQPLVRLPSLTVHVFLVLQEISTIVGFVIVAIVYVHWLHSRGRSRTDNSDPDGWRYLFWAVIIGLSFAISLPTAIYYERATPLPGFRFFLSLVFRIAIYTPDVLVPLSLIGTAVIYERRPR
jgi:hypothetical protein